MSPTPENATAVRNETFTNQRLAREWKTVTAMLEYLLPRSTCWTTLRRMSGFDALRENQVGSLSL